MDIAELRREYEHHGLRRDDLADDPFDQFERWFRVAVDADLLDASAMSLATAGEDGQPTLRTVLLKYFDRDGFVFYTNTESTKACQIAANPTVALLFYWRELARQVKITGVATPVSRAETLRYFVSRPHDSQLGAWVSQQSRAVSSRSLLEQQFDAMRRKFAAGRVPLPSFWGGYRVAPRAIEFWQGRPRRLHDRFIYRQDDGGGWRVERLAP